MRKSLLAPIAALALTAVAATASSITFNDRSGNPVSIATVTFNGLQSYLEGIIDTTGAQVDPATKQGQKSISDALGNASTTGTIGGSLATLAATVGNAGSPAGTAQTVQAATGSRFNVTYQAAPINLSAAVTAGTAKTLGSLVAGDRGWKVQNRTTGACVLSVGGIPYDVPAGGYLDNTPNLVELGDMIANCAVAGNFTAAKFAS